MLEEVLDSVGDTTEVKVTRNYSLEGGREGVCSHMHICIEGLIGCPRCN